MGIFSAHIKHPTPENIAALRNGQVAYISDEDLYFDAEGNAFVMRNAPVSLQRVAGVGRQVTYVDGDLTIWVGQSEMFEPSIETHVAQQNRMIEVKNVRYYSSVLS